MDCMGFCKYWRQSSVLFENKANESCSNLIISGTSFWRESSHGTLYAGLCRPVRRSLYCVWHRGRRLTGALRGQNQTVHGGHQDQHGHLCLGGHRFLCGEYIAPIFQLDVTASHDLNTKTSSGVSDAAAEYRHGDGVLALWLLRLLHLPGGHGAVRGVFLPGGRGHFGRTHLHIRVLNQVPVRLPVYSEEVRWAFILESGTLNRHKYCVSIWGRSKIKPSQRRFCCQWSNSTHWSTSFYYFFNQRNFWCRFRFCARFFSLARKVFIIIIVVVIQIICEFKVGVGNR